MSGKKPKKNEDIEQRRSLRRQRVFRDRMNAFELEPSEFQSQFGLSKELVMQLCDDLRDELRPRMRRRTVLPVETKVLIALRFFATGCNQKPLGSDIHLAVTQKTVSRSIAAVSDGISKVLVKEKIVFPRDVQGQRAVKQGFLEHSQFPDVIGAIDCTRVAIVAPPDPLHQREDIYMGPKGYHCVNVQLVCDADLRILDVSAEFPGSAHTAFVWKCSSLRSAIKLDFELGRNDAWLLGDIKYPLEPWLLTPFQDPEENTAASRFNTAHVKARSCIENCISLLKQRFRCLLKHRALHYSPERAASIISSCAVLHNMCIDAHLPPPSEDQQLAEQDEDSSGLQLPVFELTHDDEIMYHAAARLPFKVLDIRSAFQLAQNSKKRKHSESEPHCPSKSSKTEDGANYDVILLSEDTEDANVDTENVPLRLKEDPPSENSKRFMQKYLRVSLKRVNAEEESCDKASDCQVDLSNDTPLEWDCADSQNRPNDSPCTGSQEPQIEIEKNTLDAEEVSQDLKMLEASRTKDDDLPVKMDELLNAPIKNNILDTQDSDINIILPGQDNDTVTCSEEGKSQKKDKNTGTQDKSSKGGLSKSKSPEAMSDSEGGDTALDTSLNISGVATTNDESDGNSEGVSQEEISKGENKASEPQASKTTEVNQKKRKRLSKEEREQQKAARKNEKQRIREAARERKEQERQRLKAEKEKERAEKLARKEKEREEKKRQEEKEKAKKERLRREKKEQEEKERQEKLRQKEEERLEKLRVKEEEKLKKQLLLEAKLEEKKKKEDEKLQKLEEKRKLEEEEKKKNQKAREAFVKFFVKSQQQPQPAEDEKAEEGCANFRPFEVRKDMTLAPAVPSVTIANFQKEIFEDTVKKQSLSALYLEELRSGLITPNRVKAQHKIRERDVILIVPGEEDEMQRLQQQQQRSRRQMRPKLLQFHTNVRPPYWGTWSKNSTKINPRRPFAKDETYFDYEVDSDDEWEEEEPGESLSGTEDENEPEDDYEIDNDFFVPHGYLSPEEEQEDNEPESPETMKLRLKMKEQEFKAEMSKKCPMLRPIVIGCFFLNDVNGSQPSKELSILEPFRVIPLEAVPIVTSLSLPAPTKEDEAAASAASSSSKGTSQPQSGESAPKGTRKREVPEEAMPHFLTLIHANTNCRSYLINEFIAFWSNHQQNEASEAKDVPDAKGVETDVVPESGDAPAASSTQMPVPKTMKLLSKRQLEKSFQKFASWIRCPDPALNKYCWWVHESAREKYGLSNLPVPNQWTYLTSKKEAESAPESSQQPACGTPSIKKFTQPIPVLKSNADSPVQNAKTDASASLVDDGTGAVE